MEILRTFVEDFLTLFGSNPYWVLFLIVWLMAFFPLGLPEEVFTLLGGAAIAGNMLNWFTGSVAILCGFVCANATLYWIGRGGLKLLVGTRPGNRLIRSKKFKKARQIMLMNGMWSIVVCRFFLGTRILIYMACGFFRYKFLKFWALDTAAVLAHGTLCIFVGYVFHEQIGSLLMFIKRLGVWTLVVLVAGVGVYVYVKISRKTTPH